MPDTSKRRKGRPTRGATAVGKDKLIEAARSVLRHREPPQLSRKAVAEAAGVTPALVSYYFPDRTALLAAAAGPVIGEQVARLLAILDGGAGRTTQLRQIVGLLVEIEAGESRLIDHAVESQADPSLRALAALAQLRLTALHREGVEAGEWRALDPDWLIRAVWALCRSIPATGSTAPADRRIEMVLDLMLNGLAARR